MLRKHIVWQTIPLFRGAYYLVIDKGVSCCILP